METSHIELLEASFPGIKASIIRCEKQGFPWPSKSFVKTKDDGTPLAHVGVLEYPLFLEGQEYRMAALHAICTDASHRHQGLASTLIEEVLHWAKSRYDGVVLFSEILGFYEKFSFSPVQEYRFHLPCQHPKGSQPLIPVNAPQDNVLFLRSFRERAPLSDILWVKDNGSFASFNALFTTYPAYWSLYYSPSFDSIFSYELRDKTLHLFDIIANRIPSLDVILDHLPAAIDEIYFYFSPDRLTSSATPEPHLYDNGHFMVHGKWPKMKPFMIQPLSRC